MNEKDMQELRAALSEEQKLLKSQLDKLGQEDAEHPGDWVAKVDDLDIQAADENEVGDEMGSFQGNQALLGNIEKRYREVTAALERVDEGTYGICKVSGEPIEMERLRANPAAETSMKHMNDL